MCQTTKKTTLFDIRSDGSLNNLTNNLCESIINILSLNTKLSGIIFYITSVDLLSVTKIPGVISIQKLFLAHTVSQKIPNQYYI